MIKACLGKIIAWHKYTTLPFLLLIFSLPASAQPILTPDVPSGAPVGTTITWTLGTSAGGGDAYDYRFTIKRPGGSKLIARDYNPTPVFDWTPYEEGRYKIQATLRNRLTNELSVVSENFVITSLVDQAARVSATNHPLVALYSVPECAKARKVFVEFREANSDAPWQRTPAKRCSKNSSVNFLVAGMKAETTYALRHKISGQAHWHKQQKLYFTTGSVEVNIPNISVTRYDTQNSRPMHRDDASDLILHDTFLLKGPPFFACPFATDLQGHVVWYYKLPCSPEFSNALMNSVPHTRNETFTIQVPINLVRGQILREVDLAGNTVRETYVDRINEQLAEMGEDPIYIFHHDTRVLENGHTLVLAGTERIMHNVQGVNGPVDVVGDMVLDLDENWQVVWVWNSYKHPEKLPIERRALRDEICTIDVCGTLRQADQALAAHDWLHSNALTYTEFDGNILLSMRHQDWIIKIDYADGKGTGEILWRLGKDGDFRIRGRQLDDHPWFSGQHQPLLYGRHEMVVYDNSNARFEELGEGVNSRGQVYWLDEKRKIAWQLLNVDLGVYAPIVGSAQKLANGNYHFLSGAALDGNPPTLPQFPSADSISHEVDRSGNIVMELKAEGITYRSFRMKNMYYLNEPSERDRRWEK